MFAKKQCDSKKADTIIRNSCKKKRLKLAGLRNSFMSSLFTVFRNRKYFDDDDDDEEEEDEDAAACSFVMYSLHTLSAVISVIIICISAHG
jgi:hypothetical protein